MLRARARARESYPARPQKSSRIVASAEPRRRSPGRAFLMVEIHFTTTSLFFVDVVIACYSVSWLVRFVWCGVLCHRYRHEETAAKNQPFAAETPWVCLFFVAANVRTQSAYFFIRCTLKIFPKKNRRPKWYFSNTICSSHFVEIFSNLPRKLARLRFMRWERECRECNKRKSVWIIITQMIGELYAHSVLSKRTANGETTESIQKMRSTLCCHHRRPVRMISSPASGWFFGCQGNILSSITQESHIILCYMMCIRITSLDTWYACFLS